MFTHPEQPVVEVDGVLRFRESQAGRMQLDGEVRDLNDHPVDLDRGGV